MITIDELVGAHPFAAGLSDEHLALVAGCAQNVAFDAGAMLCAEGPAGSPTRYTKLSACGVTVNTAG